MFLLLFVAAVYITFHNDKIGDTKLLTFDSMNRTLKCDHSLESYGAVIYFGAVCFFFQFHPVFHFGKFINFGLGTVRSERVGGSSAEYKVRTTVTVCCVRITTGKNCSIAFI